MSSQNGGKINQLLKEWPKGTVATQAKLSKLGISRQLATKYVLHNWIIRIGTGAFVRSGDQIDWRGGLYALQTQLGLSVHVGARIALELQGLSHFVPLGQQEKVNLISDRP
ncbi:AbiEi antitoxin N-terminal domain-containing protein, partial [bacterium]|nr:AbiEi antitoxin N-terminal domain-containing protein [bacterium]